MSGKEIFAPFFGMMFLTFVVWLFMYARRLHYIVSNRIDTRKLTTPEKGAKLIPENVSWPAHNLRFGVYMVSAIVFWVMLFRAGLQFVAD